MSSEACIAYSSSRLTAILILSSSCPIPASNANDAVLYHFQLFFFPLPTFPHSPSPLSAAPKWESQLKEDIVPPGFPSLTWDRCIFADHRPSYNFASIWLVQLKEHSPSLSLYAAKEWPLCSKPLPWSESKTKTLRGQWGINGGWWSYGFLIFFLLQNETHDFFFHFQGVTTTQCCRMLWILEPCLDVYTWSNEQEEGK